MEQDHRVVDPYGDPGRIADGITAAAAALPGDPERELAKLRARRKARRMASMNREQVEVLPALKTIAPPGIDLDPKRQILVGWQAIANAIGEDGVSVKTAQRLHESEGLPVIMRNGTPHTTRLDLFAWDSLAAQRVIKAIETDVGQFDAI